MNLLPSDPTRRNAVLLAFLAVSGLYFVHTYLYVPETESEASRRARLAHLERWNGNEAADGIERSGSLDDQLVRYEEHIARLERLLPATGEVGVLLEAISEHETRAGVEVTIMRPEALERDEFYDRWSYVLGVRGSYHAIGSFVTAIASLDRIVVPSDMVIEPDDATGPDRNENRGIVIASFRIRTYVVATPSSTAPESPPEATGGPAT